MIKTQVIAENREPIDWPINWSCTKCGLEESRRSGRPPGRPPRGAAQRLHERSTTIDCPEDKLWLCITSGQLPDRPYRAQFLYYRRAVYSRSAARRVQAIIYYDSDFVSDLISDLLVPFLQRFSGYIERGMDPH